MPDQPATPDQTEPALGTPAADTATSGAPEGATEAGAPAPATEGASAAGNAPPASGKPSKFALFREKVRDAVAKVRAKLPGKKAAPTPPPEEIGPDGEPIPSTPPPPVQKERGPMAIIFAGLISNDPWLRKMSAIYIVSVAGIISVVILGWNRYRMEWKPKFESKGSEASGLQHLGEFIGKQAEDARRRHSQINLGSFSIELKVPGEVKTGRSVHLAQIEIVAECDNKDTCQLISSQIVKAKSQIINALVAQEREDLLSQEGKKKLKKMIIEKINLWLPRGRVENLYFSKIILG